MEIKTFILYFISLCIIIIIIMFFVPTPDRWCKSLKVIYKSAGGRANNQRWHLYRVSARTQTISRVFGSTSYMLLRPLLLHV